MQILHGGLSDPCFRCATCGKQYLLTQVARRSHTARHRFREEAEAQGWQIPLEAGAQYCPEHHPDKAHS